MKVKYISYGVGCRIGDKIYLNENLKKYPKLHRAILQHEKGHSSGFDLNDLVIDLKGRYLGSVKFEYYKFILKHPKSLSQFIPIWFYDKKFSFDPFIFIVWVLLFFVFLIGIWGVS